MPTARERAFFQDVQPWGFILFDRNLGDAQDIRALTEELRALTGRNVPILIDQEGGRVQRLRAPWREWLPPLDFVAGLGVDQAAAAMELRYRYIAAELLDLGIDVNCAPMVDVARDDTHAFLRNRCYGMDLQAVAPIGRAVLRGHLTGGVLPIMKHIPGHGLGLADSHEELPVVDASRTELATDFAPFAALADCPMAMTAHVTYSAIDADRCATLSRPMIDLIRGEIGFDGLLMTDDLSMKALGGAFETRVTQSLEAGCDMILHCNGDMDEMTAIASATPALSGKAAERADAALGARRAPEPFDMEAARAELDRLEGVTAHA
ncbi:Beta-hexosaminidase [Pontivivens insulae]|uniref:beta-N-acetylhexosaminidase n=2 Tax=Pontivivens insulae TaxID=1639689 RepID=A0A2R8ACZ4_9RHOB|nr:beta-N-acetylhexosaminidase [Pontivivens insulae]SPF29908.1 Beta-hexosaminidase [Pontivivens insulae]